MCVLICLVRASYPDAPNYCLPIQPISQDGVVQPRPEVIQGHPGKTGPRGPIGPKGSQGLPGNCGCNPSELEQLRVEMQRMNGILLEYFSIVVGLDLTELLRIRLKFKITIAKNSKQITAKIIAVYVGWRKGYFR